MRYPLLKGTIVPLGGKEYRVDDVIGEGASCIVYNVTATGPSGITYRYRLKECYPHNANCLRSGIQIIWSDEAQKHMAFRRFTKAAQIIATLRNDEAIGNNITETELIEGNGTLYSVMSVNHAKTYSCDASLDIHRILQTMLRLTRVVGKLHEQGYLHLDIKPDNFLVSYDPDPNIWLFDVDSLISMADLQSGTTSCYSYSKEWAAPELIQGKLNKLCPATDIFAIGSILFRSIMGRTVSNDDIGLFADWDFEGELFDDVNPKIKRILCTIFQRSLAANIKRRYQNAAELVSILEQACRVTAAGVPFLISDCPALSTNFFGREKEIIAIKQAFKEKSTAVFLHGEGGIGKSTLAVAYAHTYGHDYDAILFYRYKTSLEDLCVDIAEGIQNCDGDTAEKLRVLRRVLDKNILLIIDNFDVENDQDEYLDEFLRYKAQILFTTRRNFASVYSGEIQQVEVSSLPYEELQCLFCNASGLNASSIQGDQLRTLLKFVDYNTYGTELLGLQIASSGYSLGDLIEKLSHGLSGLEHTEKVRTRKDGHITKKTLPDVIRVLFKISNLSEDQKRTLRNLYVLRFLNINHETYRWYSDEFNHGVDLLNDLVEIGWVRYDPNRQFFTLHPLVEELVKSNLTPDEENCIGVYHSINQLIDKTVDYSGYDDAEEVEFENNCQFLCAFFVSSDFSIAAHRQKAIQWFLGLIEGDLYIGTPDDYYFKKLHQKLLAEVESCHTTAQETFDIRYIMVNVWLGEFHRWRIGETQEERKKREELRLLEYQRAFDNAKIAANKLSDQSKEDALNLLYAAIPRGRFPFNSDLPKSYLLQLYNERPSSFDYDVADKVFLGIPVSDEEKRNAELGRKKATPLTESSEKNSSNYSWSKHIDAAVDSIKAAESPLTAAQSLLNDGATPIFEAVALLISYCDDVINKFVCEYLPEDERQLLALANWEDFERVIDLVEATCASPNWQDEYYGYDLDENEFFTRRDNGKPYISSIYSLKKHRAIVAAIASDYTRFCSLVESDLGATDSRRNPASTIFDANWDDLALACRNIGRCAYVVRYLDRYLDELEIEPYDTEERDNIKRFVLAKEIAEAACAEVGHDDSQYAYFRSVVEKMSSIIDRITGKRYSLMEEIQTLGGTLSDDATKSDVDSKLEMLYKQRFYEAEDKVTFIKTILASTSLTPFEQANRIADCTDGVFMPFHMEIHHPNRSYELNWMQLEEVLDLEEENLISDECQLQNREEHENWNYYMNCNIVNQAIVYAATNNIEMFEWCMEIILEDIKQRVTWSLEHNEHWSHFLRLKDYYNFSLNKVVNGLSHIKKKSWIIHYLIRIEQGWKEYAARNGYHDEEVFFSWYKSIAECAEAADLERDVPTQYQQDFFKIYLSYQEKMDKIAGANYTLRQNDE